MSVITSFQPVPNRVRTVARIVAEVGRIDRENLINHLMPLDPKRDQAGDVIREAIRIGLISEDKGEIKIGDGLNKSKLFNDEFCVYFMERAIYSSILPEDNDNRAVAFATAWFLTGPISPRIEWRSEMAQVMRQEMDGDDNYDINSTDRASMLSYWMRYAGYGEQLRFLDKTYIIPDPTRALARQMPNLLKGSESAPLGQFVSKMGSVLPVLETGTVRKQVEERLKVKRDDHSISPATSFALQQLAISGLIKLHYSSDAAVVFYLDTGLSERKRYSHIERLE